MEHDCVPDVEWYNYKRFQIPQTYRQMPLKDQQRLLLELYDEIGFELGKANQDANTERECLMRKSMDLQQSDMFVLVQLRLRELALHKDNVMSLLLEVDEKIFKADVFRGREKIAKTEKASCGCM